MSRIAFLLFGLMPLAGLGFADDVPPAVPRVDDLDKVIQARFGSVTEEDIHQGRLGVSRVARPARRRIFVPANDQERAPLVRLCEEGWSASLYVLGLEGRLSGPIRTGAEAVPAGVEGAEVVKLGKRAIEKQEALLGLQGAVRMEARPIPVSGRSCAGCHDPSLKEGDPLGAVVYVLRRTVSP